MPDGTVSCRSHASHDRHRFLSTCSLRLASALMALARPDGSLTSGTTGRLASSAEVPVPPPKPAKTMHSPIAADPFRRFPSQNADYRRHQQGDSDDPSDSGHLSRACRVGRNEEAQHRNGGASRTEHHQHRYDVRVRPTCRHSKPFLLLFQHARVKRRPTRSRSSPAALPVPNKRVYTETDLQIPIGAALSILNALNRTTPQSLSEASASSTHLELPRGLIVDEFQARRAAFPPWADDESQPQESTHRSLEI